MFKHPFSFSGRIRRTEYGLSYVLYCVAVVIHFAITTIIYNVFENYDNLETAIGISILCYIPIIWFMLAQSAKRCHDLGKSGWWQLIPFYEFWLLFEDGQRKSNNYGENPKEMQYADNQIFMQ